MADRGTNEIRVIDTASFTEVTTVPVGTDPWGLDISEDGSTLVVTCEDSSEVYVIDTATLTPVAIPLDPDADPRDVDIHEGRWEAFVTGGRTGRFPDELDPIYVIDLATRTLVRSFESAGANGNVIAVWPSVIDCGPDSDGDGFGDDCDTCPGLSDPGQEDRDSDGVGDACDLCPDEPDPGQEDDDGDGVGNACETCPGGDDLADRDSDGVPDDCDLCPDVSDPAQDDADGDGVGDACDLCPGGDDALDGDGDGVADACDNCPDTRNPGQEDADGDGQGDACEDPVGCTDPPEAAGLRVARDGDDLLLSLDALDPSEADSWSLLAGTLTTLAAASYDHEARACGLTGTEHRDLGAAVAGDLYYLAAAHCTASGDGPLGIDSLANPRPGTTDLGTPGCP